MNSNQSELVLYHLSLKRPSASVKSVIGSFTGHKSKQEIIVALHSSLIVYSLDTETGQLHKQREHELFCIVQNIAKFRIPGSIQHCLIITSDSGNITLTGLNEKIEFESLVNHPLTKTGLRRLNPSCYIAVDPKNRSFMLCALEKNKIITVLNRNSEDNTIKISSPLEANISKVVTFYTCALDVGYDNPLTATIECNYDSPTKKHLSYYELDLGLNHVVKKYTEEIPFKSNFLISIPRDAEGPSGLLLCSQGIIQFKFLNKRTHYLPIPRRTNQKEPSYIINGECHKMKNTFFFLLQSDLGDIFKVSVNYKEVYDDTYETKEVSSIEIKYFDSLPVCLDLHIFKSGFLFADTEIGDKYLYQFEKLGDDDDATIWNSENYPDEESVYEDQHVYFDTKELDNLSLVYILDCLNPITDGLLDQEKSQLVLTSGSSSRSSLKLLKHELAINELASSELPGSAFKIFTTKVSYKDQYDKYMVISFIDGTLVLSIGESVDEVSDSGLELQVSTISVQQVGRNSLAQVHSLGLVHLKGLNEPNFEKTLWQPPVGVEILVASMTNSQIALGLSNRELVYFEIDEYDQLIEHKERKEMSGRISSLSLGQVPDGRLRAPFLAVGCNDMTIKILSTDPESCLEVLSLQALSSIPSDLQITNLEHNTGYFVHIGLDSGIYIRTLLNSMSGQLSDTRVNYLGPKRVSLSPVTIFGKDLVVAFSDTSYLSYNSGFDAKITPLCDGKFTHGCGFISEECPENGIVAVSGENLAIFTIDQLDTDMNVKDIPLTFTPRRITNVSGDIVVVTESQPYTKNPYLNSVATEESRELYQQIGYEKSTQWSSVIETVDIQNQQIIQVINLDQELAIFGSTKVRFESHPDEVYFIVSCSVDQELLPNTNKGTQLRTYKISEKGLQFLHSTETDQLVYSLIEFQGKLLAGVGNFLVLYDLGLKKLLKKSLTQTNFQQISSIDYQGFRVVISDMKQSSMFLSFNVEENRFIALCDDITRRHTTCSKMLDYSTVVTGDRFGNISVLRCPPKVNKDHDDYIEAKSKMIGECPFKLKQLASYYVQDVVTSLSRGSLTVGGKQSIIYTGLQGTIGILSPIQTPSDIEFFVSLEDSLRQELLKSKHLLTGRSHLKYRGYYVPAQGVVDGDLIQYFYQLPDSTKQFISTKLDRSTLEIERKISIMRSLVAL
ncbi:BA75_03511T0 [Komagataella pastoris]|uniref:BA75_03511T0 n=1 Tax=Komagataella pastoris TaxID=4922 RepID=A0A1B2JEM6_PICPA|nr:BA75_03511T0 [Komagataella pastoris]